MAYQRKRLELESMGDSAVFLTQPRYERLLTLRTTMRYPGVAEFVLGEEDMLVLRGILDVKLDRIAQARELAEQMREAGERAERARLASLEPVPEQPQGLPEF